VTPLALALALLVLGARAAPVSHDLAARLDPIQLPPKIDDFMRRDASPSVRPPRPRPAPLPRPRTHSIPSSALTRHTRWSSPDRAGRSCARVGVGFSCASSLVAPRFIPTSVHRTRTRQCPFIKTSRLRIRIHHNQLNSTSNNKSSPIDIHPRFSTTANTHASTISFHRIPSHVRVSFLPSPCGLTGCGAVYL
jgi:hypothetical protein